MCVALTSSTTPSGLITTVPDPNPVVPTVVAPSGSCRSDEFQCDDGSCVGRDFRCDNVPDCGDASDEDNCNISRFPLSMFISLSLSVPFSSLSHLDWLSTSIYLPYGYIVIVLDVVVIVASLLFGRPLFPIFCTQLGYYDCEDDCCCRSQ